MSVSMRDFEIEVPFSGGGRLFAFCYDGGFGHYAVGWEGCVAVCSGLVQGMSRVGFLGWVDEDIGEGDVSAVEELTQVAVSIEEVFKMEYGRVSHGIGR